MAAKGVPLDATPFDEHVRLIAADAAVVVLTMAATFVFCTKPGSTLHDRLVLTHEVWWYPFVFVLLFNAFAATYHLSPTVATRWTGSCAESSRFFRLYVAAQLAAIPVELLTAGRKALPMLGHHVVSIASYVYGLHSRRCAFFGTAAGLSEVSTIFLEGVLLSKRPDLGWLFDNVPWFLPLNGALLWLTYIIFRLALFPTLLAVYVHDSWFAPSKEARKLTTWPVARHCVYVIPISLVFLFFLSAAWFSKIHRGFMDKVVGALRSKEASSSAKDDAAAAQCVGPARSNGVRAAKLD
mmetsp:Transcript_15110/g.60704  ORF Transcript_15110/g.60704 Transcript_15110/m.60704 type:complete len:296 (+) Transcript_15110:81-968(+)